MWCTELQQHIEVGIEDTNRVDQVIIDTAISNLPRRSDTDPAEVHRLAAAGDLNAMHIVDAAAAGDPVAQDYV